MTSPRKPPTWTLVQTKQRRDHVLQTFQGTSFPQDFAAPLCTHSPGDTFAIQSNAQNFSFGLPPTCIAITDVISARGGQKESGMVLDLEILQKTRSSGKVAVQRSPPQQPPKCCSSSCKERHRSPHPPKQATPGWPWGPGPGGRNSVLSHHPWRQPEAEGSGDKELGQSGGAWQ